MYTAVLNLVSGGFAPPVETIILLHRRKLGAKFSAAVCVYTVVGPDREDIFNNTKFSTLPGPDFHSIHESLKLRVLRVLTSETLANSRGNLRIA